MRTIKYTIIIYFFVVFAFVACCRKTKTCDTACPNNTTCVDGVCGCEAGFENVNNVCLAVSPNWNENLYALSSIGNCSFLEKVFIKFYSFIPDTAGSIDFNNDLWLLDYSKTPASGNLHGFGYYPLSTGDSIKSFIEGYYGNVACTHQGSTPNYSWLYGKFNLNKDTLKLWMVNYCHGLKMDSCSTIMYKVK